MKGLFWLLVIGLVMTAAGIVWYILRKAAEQRLALAIQLYARLPGRYPASSFAEPARAAVAALKKKLVKD